MYALSKFSFFQNYNKEKFTKQEASEKGFSTLDIKKCDKDGDGVLSVSEILENSDACAKILANINAEQTKVVNEIKQLQARKIQTLDEERKAEKEPEKAGDKIAKFGQRFKNIFRQNADFSHDFKDIFKRPNRFGDDYKFNVAAQYL